MGMKSSREQFTVFDAAVPAARASWLALWQAWPNRDVTAHPGYTELFARPGDRVVCLAQDRVRGGILFPLIVRPIALESWGMAGADVCDLVSPYGYGGPYGWGKVGVEEFWSGFDDWACSMRAVSLFARLSLFKEHLIPFYGDTMVKSSCVVVPLDKEPEALLRSYDKAARENVHQARRAGVTIEVDTDCHRLDDFLAVYHATMDRLNAQPMYYFQKPFFERLIASLSERVLLVHAIHQNRVVSSEMLLRSETHLYSFLGGTLPEGFPVRANPLIRHGVNEWGRKHGIPQVNLGGGYAGEDSLMRYKQRYAPTSSVSFCVGTRIMDVSMYLALIERRAAWERRLGNEWTPACGYFPAYRAQCSGEESHAGSAMRGPIVDRGITYGEWR
jgi:hypothetical protein